MDRLGVRAPVAMTEQERIVTVLTNAGHEIYRRDTDVVQLAERVRMHLMDSGVTVRPEPDGDRRASVTVAFRCQRSDFPVATADELHRRIVKSLHLEAVHAGFAPRAGTTRQITNPVDESHVLDVWFEVTYWREVEGDDALREAVAWALQMPKCITP